MQETDIIHASSVAFQGSAAVILGQSGSGKSSLALQLMAFGADIVADDHTIVTNEGGVLMAQAPSTIDGLVEARGVGILRAHGSGPAAVRLFVDLDQQERNRLPEYHSKEVLGVALPCLFKSDAPHFAASVLLFLKHGRKDPAAQ